MLHTVIRCFQMYIRILSDWMLADKATIRNGIGVRQASHGEPTCLVCSDLHYPFGEAIS